jgi:hypothetical protein
MRVWIDLNRSDRVRYGTVRYAMVRYGAVRYVTVWYGTVRYGTVRYGTAVWSTQLGHETCCFVKGAVTCCRTERLSYSAAWVCLIS